MKIRVISDLHIDINALYPFSLKRDGIFTVVCGDTSGFLSKTKQWIKDNVDHGVFIIGNHYGYNDEMLPYQDIVAKLKRSFPRKKDVTFLQNSYKEIGDYVFVGATLWTDYWLGCHSVHEMELAMVIAKQRMNDFRYCGWRYPDKVERTISPLICVQEHEKSLKCIDKVCNQFPQKKIVVVTHHAPSELSISNKYRSSDVNGAYASNLEEFILKHPNIKLWCHGHVHEDNDYMIGGTRVVCNPRGYVDYDAPHKFDKDLIVEI